MEDLFYMQHIEFDKTIVSKAFVDAFVKNDITIISPFITNPIHYSYNFDIRDDMMDKKVFLKLLSNKINEFHEYGNVTAKMHSKYTENECVLMMKPDVWIKAISPFDGCKSLELYLDTF